MKGRADGTTASGNPRPLRVLWVTDKLGYEDGLHDVGHSYLDVFPVLKGVEVIPAVLRSSPDLARQLQARQIPLRELHHGKFDPRTLWTLLRCIRTEQVDVLHLHGYGAAAFGRLAGWLTGTPAILHQYDSPVRVPWYVRFSDRVLSRTTSHAIASSESAKEFCVSQRSLPSDQVLVWQGGVSGALVHHGESRAALRRRLGVSEHHLVVGTIGRLRGEDGVRCLLEAAAVVLRRQPEVIVVIVGDGPERRPLEAAAGRLGIADRLRFVPDRDGSDELLEAFDCFVRPVFHEGLSAPLLRAMTRGVPIVSTAVGVANDVLRHGENGWLVPARDPRALAEGLLRVLGDAGLRERLADNARGVTPRYTVSRYAEQLVRLYEQTVSRQRQAGGAATTALTQRFRTLLRYAAVGVMGSLVHFGLLTALVELAGWPVLAATTVGFLAAVASNFAFNRRWTFNSRERNIRLQFTRFLLVSLCGLAINLVLMAVLVTLWGLSYLVGQLLTTGVVWWWNFLASTYWTFQPIRFTLPPELADDMAGPEISIVIPAFNEVQRLGPTVSAAAAYANSRGLRAEIVVVDDGSSDGTLSLGTQLPVSGVAVRVIHNPINQGKGAAVRDGFLAASGRYVLMIDADNATPLECLDAFWSARTARTIFVGSRYVGGRRPEVSRLRFLIGRFGNQLIRWFLLPGIQDTQCGFKLFSRPVARTLAARQRIRRFGFDMELLAIARALGVEIREVPVRWTAIPGSRVRPLRDAWRTLGELVLVKALLWSGQYHTEVALPAAAEPVAAGA